MKKQLTSPCNDCSRLKRFFCLISCKDYDQWHMDQYLRPMFAAPDPVETFTDLDSKDELIDTLCATINELREDVSLYKAAEQYCKQENAMLQATLMDHTRDIERFANKADRLRNSLILIAKCIDPDSTAGGIAERAIAFDDNAEEDEHHGKVDEIRVSHAPVERCDYCKELHDPRIACPEYAATIKGIEEVAK